MATISDEQIRELQRSDKCLVCRCGLLAPAHHNNFMDDYHAFTSIPDELFVTALYEFDYPTAREKARRDLADIVAGRDPGRALAVACRKCGAHVGEPCMTMRQTKFRNRVGRTGALDVQPHRERTATLNATGRR